MLRRGRCPVGTAAKAGIYDGDFSLNPACREVKLKPMEKPGPDRESDQRLHDAILAYVAAHPSPAVQKFRDGIANRNWEWVGVYPPHRHKAEEVYSILAGGMEFLLGDSGNALRATHTAGESIYVPSMLTHGFRTRDRPLAVFYIWQNGDLREKSTFA